MKKTMKQYSFTSQLKSLAVVFGIALTFASCANEDVAQNPTNPNEDNDKNLTTFVAGDETKTRTSLNYSSGDFYWEAGDYIYVKDDDGTLQKSSNAPTSKVASFKYKVPGKFTGNSYKVYYLGKNSNATDKKVTISATQVQTKPDNTEHFGIAGDYGTATATKVTGKQQFAFELEHQPAYLVFQPYTSNTILHDCYLTKVEVTSDNDIAETYTINTSTGNLDTSAGGKQIVLTTKSYSGAYTKGFPLTNNAASVTTNGAYMVIKPGTHTLKVRYWVKDVVTTAEGTITKLLPSTAYASNTFYDMAANLEVKNYDADNYYMWDAQQQYWYGFEWTTNLPSGIRQSTIWNEPVGNYPKNNSDPRYYNGSFPGLNVSNPATHAPCKDLPNVNEMTWYAQYGDPRWDDEVWTTMGHLYAGGMWFKKRAYITGYNANTASDGTDWRTTNKGHSWSVSNVLPSAADASKYFYLPALGSYRGTPSFGFGSYWTSSASSTYQQYAYCLTFSASSTYVGNGDRYAGFRVKPSFE